jgi:hypothetical protein
MSAERAVKEFVEEVAHITGVKMRIGWVPLSGLFLKDTETGATYPLGLVKKSSVLSVGEQESICRSLHREAWLVLLGLDAPQEGD